MANQTKDKIDLKQALTTYFKSVKLEWGKITWPGKQDVIRETVLVIVITAVFTIGVLAVDKIFEMIFKGLGLIH